MDATNGLKRDHGGMRRPSTLSLSFARPRYEILRCLQGDSRNKSGQNSISTASKSKLKCLRRAMGTIGQGRVLVEDHPFWRPLPADHVGLSLMIPLSVVVCNIFAHCPLGGRRPRGGRGTCPRRKDRAGVEATQDCWLTRGYGSAGRSEYHVLSDKRPRCGLDKTAERPL